MLRLSLIAVLLSVSSVQEPDKLVAEAHTTKPDEKPKKPTKLWAAFVLSGVGK
jgi:hypothetical protein